MSIEAVYIFGAIAIGIGATLVMDLWNLFLKRTFNMKSLVTHTLFGVGLYVCALGVSYAFAAR